MKLNDFKNIYVGGCSLTAGGGLTEPHIKKKYKELYDIEWVDVKDILYPKILSEKLNIKYCINDAKSGSGTGRLVRRIYEYIKKHGIHTARETIFILQINESFNRVEYFSNKLNDYLVINPQWGEDMSLNSIGVTDGWYENEKTLKDYFFEEETIYFKEFITKYHNPLSYAEKCYFDLVGLFSFLEKSKIKYFYIVDGNFIGEGFDFLYQEIQSNRIFVDGFETINTFCGFNKLRISDDIKEKSDDHPGYFGHQKFAEKLYDEILIKTI